MSDKTKDRISAVIFIIMSAMAGHLVMMWLTE